MIKLTYINTGYSSVFDSQVLGYLDFCQRNGRFDMIVLLCGYRDKEELKKLKAKTDHKQFQTTYFRYFPNYPVYNLLNSIAIFFALSKAGVKDKNSSTFHVRGEISAMHATFALKMAGIRTDRILADIRGTAAEEISQFRKGRKFLLDMKIRNYNKAVSNLRSVGEISMVSAALLTYIEGKLDVAEKSLSIIPCLSGENFSFSRTDRERIRNLLNIRDNELLLVFSSNGEAAWQNASELDQANLAGFKILNLSRRKLEYPGIINMIVPHNEMPAYLSAADAGLIFRDRSIVNRAASPVKFSEYVCMGLPVVTNRNVDVITAFIEQTGFGVFIGSISELTIDKLQILKSFSRENISEEGNKRFSVNKVSDEYFNVYRRMNKRND